MIIGHFEQRDRGYAGCIAAIGFPFTESVTIDPAPKGADYIVSAIEGAELGAAWKRTSREGKPYLSVKLDSPFLAGPVNCALIAGEDGSHVLIWSRERREPEHAA